MTTRRAHQLKILQDVDALHALAVASAALVVSGGLLYVGYLVHVTRVARRSPTLPLASASGAAVLVFGKRCKNGEADADFKARIARARHLASNGHTQQLLLLGGGPSPTEAEVAARELRALGLPDHVRVMLEHDSRDTLQNLRNARQLLGDAENTPAVLLSSRYHLARCGLFARNLGISHQLCAAEDQLGWRLPTCLRLLSEAAYLMWVDIGMRWARLIGHRRMLAKIS
ncbi:MAG: YdcF family protein [Pseudomarimonas sp.]